MGEVDYGHRSLLDKLGIKDGVRLTIVDPDHLLDGEADFRDELAGRAVDLVARGAVDVVIWALEDAAALARLPSLIVRIQPAGALWAVWPKGRKELNENHIREAALDAGLVDVKVARFSATHSALKLVVPKAKR